MSFVFLSVVFLTWVDFCFSGTSMLVVNDVLTLIFRGLIVVYSLLKLRNVRGILAKSGSAIWWVKPPKKLPSCFNF